MSFLIPNQSITSRSCTLFQSSTQAAKNMCSVNEKPAQSVNMCVNAAPQLPAKTMYVNVNGVNVRSMPSTTGNEALKKLRTGAEVKVIREVNGWSLIAEKPDQWIKSEFLSSEAPKGGPVGKLISSGEGGYGSFNRGVAGDSGKETVDFSQMTIKEIKAQQSKPQGDPDRVFAVGKYQITPVTMDGAVEALKLKESDKLTNELQERIFREYLIGKKRAPIKKYVTGESDDLVAAQLALSQEFASVENPNTGKSYYDGLAGNSASISAKDTAEALVAERNQYKAKDIKSPTKPNGMDPEVAWVSLSEIQ